jgi:hypothetical protein
MPPIGARARQAWVVLAACVLIAAAPVSLARSAAAVPQAHRVPTADSSDASARGDSSFGSAPDAPDPAIFDLGDLAGPDARSIEAGLEGMLAGHARAVARLAAEAARAAADAARAKNHLWIPDLHISQPVTFFPCDRTRRPDNYLYQWGCAGTNNLYLLGHAYSVLKPLHDAFVSGRLRKGTVALYSDAKGHLTKYVITEWQLVRPTQVRWATAAQPTPSMTLQTCIGATSLWRLNVRLVSVP